MQNKMSVPNMDSKLNELQGLEIGHSLSAFLRNEAKQYEDSNGNISTKEPVGMEVTDNISVFPQAQNKNLEEAQNKNLEVAKDDLPSGFLGNPITEDKEPDQQTDLETGLAASQGGRPTSHTDIQAQALKIGFKVSCWVTALSATGIISVLVGYIGDHTSLTRKLLFKACMLSLCGSFVSGAALFLLSIIRPNTPILIPTVKSLTWTSVGLVALTVGLGTCILLRTS